MAVYRFRVAFEDYEEIYREIEIKSNQNFEDFHTIILQSIDFDKIHNSSFFISDDLWHKGDEIELNPSNNDSWKGNDNTDIAKRQMSKCKMASLIEDPHQKFVYIYDPKTSWTFLVELIKIVLDDDNVAYPICVKTVGDAPKQYKISNAVPVIPDEDDFDEDEPHIDDEAYTNAHNDDELAVLEGEEGEEEETAGDEPSEEGDEFGGSDIEDSESFSEED